MSLNSKKFYFELWRVHNHQKCKCLTRRTAFLDESSDIWYFPLKIAVGFNGTNSGLSRTAFSVASINFWTLPARELYWELSGSPLKPSSNFPQSHKHRLHIRLLSPKSSGLFFLMTSWPFFREITGFSLIPMADKRIPVRYRPLCHDGSTSRGVQHWF